MFFSRRVCWAITLLLATLSQAALAQSRGSGIDPDGFDKSVRAQDDLFLHVNGRWLLRIEIPADKSNDGSFNKSLS